MKLDTIRISELAQALKCELAFYKSRTEPEPPKSAVMYIGTIVHLGLQHYFLRKSKFKESIDWKTLNNMFEKDFDYMKHEVDFGKISEEKARSTALAYLQNYYRKRCGVLYPKVVEKRLKMKVKQNGKEIIFSGQPDLITTSLIDTEFKTTSAISSWTQNRADNELQAHFYPLLANTHGIKIKGFQFEVFNEKEVKVFPVKYNPHIVKQAIQSAFNLQRCLSENNIENLKISRSKMVCNMCSWKEKCERRKK